jgi:hypothetical protein
MESMTDMTLAEREQLEALITHTIEQTRTDAEKAEAQARLDAQIADYRLMRACENGAARVYLDGVDLGTLVGPETTVFDIFRSFEPGRSSCSTRSPGSADLVQPQLPLRLRRSCRFVRVDHLLELLGADVRPGLHRAFH